MDPSKRVGLGILGNQKKQDVRGRIAFTNVAQQQQPQQQQPPPPPQQQQRPVNICLIDTSLVHFFPSLPLSLPPSLPLYHPLYVWM